MKTRHFLLPLLINNNIQPGIFSATQCPGAVFKSCVLTDETRELRMLSRGKFDRYSHRSMSPVSVTVNQAEKKKNDKTIAESSIEPLVA